MLPSVIVAFYPFAAHAPPAKAKRPKQWFVFPWSSSIIALLGSLLIPGLLLDGVGWLVIPLSIPYESLKLLEQTMWPFLL